MNALIHRLRQFKRRQDEKWFSWRHENLDRYFFIHINRTGGTSIKRALKLPWDHMTARDKIARVGEAEWNRRFTFAVVRNPWDRMVSIYNYRVQTNQNDLGDGQTAYKEWLRRVLVERDPLLCRPGKMFKPQLEWTTDQEGRTVVDLICRFERLEEDFALVCRRIGNRALLPHLKATVRRHYRDYYDDETYEIVETFFEKDISHFGYGF